jgi:hypothetical protein
LDSSFASTGKLSAFHMDNKINAICGIDPSPAQTIQETQATAYAETFYEGEGGDDQTR